MFGIQSILFSLRLLYDYSGRTFIASKEFAGTKGEVGFEGRAIRHNSNISNALNCDDPFSIINIFNKISILF